MATRVSTSGGCRSVDQAPLEARDQALLQVLDLAGRPVAGQHDLLVRLVQGVERVEELLLDALLAGQELDVVDQQHIGLAVLPAEPDQLVVLDGVDVLVGELLGGDVGDARALLVAARRAGRWRAAGGSCPSRRRRRGRAGCRTCPAPGPRPARPRGRSVLLLPTTNVSKVFFGLKHGVAVAADAFRLVRRGACAWVSRPPRPGRRCRRCAGEPISNCTLSGCPEAWASTSWIRSR